MAFISGDSLIINKNYTIEDHISFKNYIIPLSPSITKSILIVSPRALSGDLNCFRIWNYSPYSVILQYRYGDGIDEIYNLFTINSKALVWLEHSSADDNFSVVGFKALNDSRILNQYFLSSHVLTLRRSKRGANTPQRDISLCWIGLKSVREVSSQLTLAQPLVIRGMYKF